MINPEQTEMKPPQDVLDIILRDKRTHRFFSNRQIDLNVLHKLYDAVKFGPTASNLCPMRIVFVQSPEQKQHVISAAAEGNKVKIDSAPVTAIIAHDTAYHQHIEELSPHMDAEAFRKQDAAKLKKIAVENSWLQAGYFILAARALGLDCGPMSGFDKAKIDEAFFMHSSWRSDMLINLGYGLGEKLHPRGARLPFEEACQIL